MLLLAAASLVAFVLLLYMVSPLISPKPLALSGAHVVVSGPRGRGGAVPGARAPERGPQAAPPPRAVSSAASAPPGPARARGARVRARGISGVRGFGGFCARAPR